MKNSVIVLLFLVFTAALSGVSTATTPLWQTTLEGYTLSAPSVYDAKVYIGSDDGKLYSLDLVTGAQNWAYNGRADQFPWDQSILRIHTRPGVYGATEQDVRLYTTTTNGYLFAINLDGTLYWKQRPTLDENGTPALWNGWVYFGNSGQIHMLAAATGSIEQTSPAFGSHIEGGVSIPGTDLVWFGSTNGWIYCLQASNLSLVRAAISGGSQPILGPPNVDLRGPGGIPRMIIGTGNGRVRAIHATAFNDLWTTVVGDAVNTAPWIDYATNKVIIGCNDGKIYVLDEATGSILGTYQAEAALKAPVVINGIIYVGDANGKLYAVKLSDLSLQWSYSTGGALTDTAFGEANGHVYMVAGSSDGKVYCFQVQ